jgi:nitroreductase
MIRSGNPNSIERAKSEDFCIYYNAPTFIIVSGDDKAIAPKNDCSLAIQNMFLAAESLGIGSCWINIMNFLLSSEDGRHLRSELGIPDGYTVVGSGAFGYKAVEQPAPAPRKEGTVNYIR